MIDAVLLFWYMLKGALLSTTGSGNLPIVHEDLMVRGWATEQNFAESLAIGQISPGPSGLWVISLGYLVDGLRGAILTLVAITLPPLIVLAINGFYQRYGAHPAIQGFVRGLSLAVSGIYFVVLADIMDTSGWSITNAALVLGTIAISATRRIPVIVVLILAALVGILVY